jgi:hypothetical protein
VAPFAGSSGRVRSLRCAGLPFDCQSSDWQIEARVYVPSLGTTQCHLRTFAQEHETWRGKRRVDARARFHCS